MVKQLLGLVVFVGASTCSVYAPTLRDCTVHCSETGTCPGGTTCNEGFCRPEGFSGACDCAVGSSEVCGGGQGECKAGLRLCLDSRIWGPCLGEVKPSTEQCNGKDDDCDGTVDEEVSTAPACALTLGVCANTTRSCVDGGFAATCGPAAYGPSYEAIEQTCDGLDNDCDGATDARPSVRLAQDVNAWAVETVPGGYVLFTAPAGSSTVAAQQYDDLLKPRGPITTVDVGVALARFQGHASANGTVVVGFVRVDGSMGLLRVTTSEPTPVTLERPGSVPPTTWSVSVLDDGQVQAAFERDGGLVLAAWAPGSQSATVTGYTTRFPVDVVTGVSLTSDGTVLSWGGDVDPKDGGSPVSVGGVESLDGGRAVATSGLGRYVMVPTPGRLQVFLTFSNYLPLASPNAINESGVIYCDDVWQANAVCTVFSRVQDHERVSHGTARRLQDDMVVGWLEAGALNFGTALPTVKQVRSRVLQSTGMVADFEFGAAQGSRLLAVFYRSLAEPTSVQAALVCPP